jgi:hypothetical protein
MEWEETTIYGYISSDDSMELYAVRGDDGVIVACRIDPFSRRRIVRAPKRHHVKSVMGIISHES